MRLTALEEPSEKRAGRVASPDQPALPQWKGPHLLASSNDSTQTGRCDWLIRLVTREEASKPVPFWLPRNHLFCQGEAHDAGPLVHGAGWRNWCKGHARKMFIPRCSAEAHSCVSLGAMPVLSTGGSHGSVGDFFRLPQRGPESTQQCEHLGALGSTERARNVSCAARAPRRKSQGQNSNRVFVTLHVSGKADMQIEAVSGVQNALVATQSSLASGQLTFSKSSNVKSIVSPASPSARLAMELVPPPEPSILLQSAEAKEAPCSATIIKKPHLQSNVPRRSESRIAEISADLRCFDFQPALYETRGAVRVIWSCLMHLIHPCPKEGSSVTCGP